MASRDLTDEDLEVLERAVISREVRLPVLRFARAMEQVLRHNDYKGGWKGCTVQWLRQRMNEEVKESNKTPDDINEIIDVANFCMMIWDNSPIKSLRRNTGK